MNTTALNLQSVDTTEQEALARTGLRNEPSKLSSSWDTGNLRVQESGRSISHPPKRVTLPSVPLKWSSNVRFFVEKAWLGTVTAVNITTKLGDQGFRARLVEVAGPAMEGEFSLEEVSDDDRELVRVGAEFYWNFGYVERCGQRSRESFLRFRRLPAWSQSQIDCAEAEADHLLGLFDD